MKKKKSYGYKQGKFIPMNKNKYKGKYPIYARSSWEFQAFRMMDQNPNILTWGSESIVIPYIDPSRNNTLHRYFIDLSFTTKKDERIITYWVEIKPQKQCRPPIKGRKSQKTFINESVTWVRNKAKWNAAIKAAKNKGIKFAIWTEEKFSVLA